ncbi:mfs general substrate transporter [Trichoderma arundinaceum]|uniref:Mfs general substrate transporter n=1 Tax=Trichoderma arundinaceum TaxID=490622 RepID=A0A395ND69_TRIAR|nr:mfs general substrate transporter [Trichoderma arundinaceum]
MNTSNEAAAATLDGSSSDDTENQRPSQKEKTSDDLTPLFQQSISSWKWYSICVGLYLTTLLYGLDTSIAADVQGPILASLGEIEKLSWVGIGFPMGSVATILLLRSLYGAFDIKWLYLASIILFEVGSAPSLLASSGVGYIMLCWGAGCILGPVVGGAFASSVATWRWSFYINLALAAATAPVYVLWFPRHNPQPTISTKSKLAAVDWVGAALNTSTFALFMVVLAYAGTAWEWNSGGSIGLWIAFDVSLVSYAVQQTFCIFTSDRNRLFPVHFLKRRTMLLLYFTTASASASLFVAVYFTMLSGILLPVFGYYMPWYIPSGALMSIGGALMYIVTPSTSVGAIYGVEVLIAVGAGLSSQLAYAIAPAKVKAHEVSAAIGFINVTQLGSISIALAISGSIHQNLELKYLPGCFTGI